ncbi:MULTISPECIES: hypothetical protein [unclassified Streptomyces]|uniref:hypothetical protein n=1 Tax=unclassified Streptomyces TaxID=2593676 RepID=UPI00037E69A2|nr:MULTISPECIES: hypothetical protein [unclassified Streptomyces]MYT33104.1 hypothetical protein [Streptomyces sp. SID8354]
MLAFLPQKITIAPTGLDQSAVSAAGVDFPGKIRLNDRNRPIVDVALRSFHLEVTQNGRSEDFEIGLEDIILSIDPNAYQHDAEITVRAQLSPRVDARHNASFAYRGWVEVLVIAELEDGHR